MYSTRSRSVPRPLLEDEPVTDPAYSPHARWLDNALSDHSPAPPPEPSRLVEWLAGSKAALPLAVGIVPLMLIYGVLARAAGLSPVEAQAMTLLVFSGAQLVAAQMLIKGTPAALIAAAGAAMNVRHLFYSAALAPSLKRLSLGWRLLLAYLLTDETFALSISRSQQQGAHRFQHWFLLGSGVIIWLTAQSATLVGVLLGGQVPTGWHLDYTAPLTFLGLLVLSLNNRAGYAAALCAGVTALLTVSLPLNAGFLVAVGLGTSAGMLVDHLARPGMEERA